MQEEISAGERGIRWYIKILCYLHYYLIFDTFNIISIRTNLLWHVISCLYLLLNQKTWLGGTLSFSILRLCFWLIHLRLFQKRKSRIKNILKIPILFSFYMLQASESCLLKIRQVMSKSQDNLIAGKNWTFLLAEETYHIIDNHWIFSCMYGILHFVEIISILMLIRY